ncbi:type II CAAX endopeptidase family protein [Priestia filamentosa]|uniref:CPBP family intramembrane glutamic endopeptidase n=1 Tax=Priestia filamentosa TaxID=1402861 RepID=UPI002E1C5CAD|nr:type II CAAX endopeptidase family protein [Priestia filamentosa]
MILEISKRKRALILLSPIIVILLGFITAAIFSKFIDGWAWIPLAIVYWSSLGFCIVYFKENKHIKDWLKKPKISILPIILSLLLGMFPLSILIMNYKLFDSTVLIVLWILFALINPWFEELYWRGVLLDAAVDWFPKWISVLYTTIFFVLSHPFMWGVFSIASTSYHLYIYLTVMGIVWSLTYFKTKSLRWVILSHFIVDVGNLTVLTFLNIYVPPTM